MRDAVKKLLKPKSKNFRNDNNNSTYFNEDQTKKKSEPEAAKEESEPTKEEFDIKNILMMQIILEKYIILILIKI